VAPSSCEVSQAPSIVRPSSLNVPLKRCQNRSGEKSGFVRESVQTPSSSPISYTRATPRESK